jgi:predicted amidohydrolase
VIAEGGESPEVVYAELDLAKVDAVRSLLPSLAHDRPFAPPAA